MEQITSPAGNTYPAAERIVANYWSDDTSPWKDIGSADMDGDLSYEFSEVRVYQHEKTRELVIAFDSGCSCPSPFEDTTVDDVEFLASLVDFDDFVAKHEVLDRDWDTGEQTRNPRVVDEVSLLRRQVEDLL